MRRDLFAIGTSLTLLAILAISPGLAAAESATPVLDRIKSSGVVRVGMTGGQPPLNMRAKDGSLIGMEVDLANALASAMGVEAKFVQIPFDELLESLEKGKVDMVMSGMTMTPERNMDAAFAGPYFISGKAVLTKTENLSNFDEVDDLDESVRGLAVLSGSTSEDFAKSMVPDASLIRVKDYDEGIKLVIDGKAQAMVADFPICVISVLRNPGAGLATAVLPFSFEPIGVALPKEDPTFVNLVQNYMGMLDQIHIMELLEAKWFEDGAWLSEIP